MDKFIDRVERTVLVDLCGEGENLRRHILEVMSNRPEESWGDLLRELMTIVLESEAGIAAEEYWNNSDSIIK